MNDLGVLQDSPEGKSPFSYRCADSRRKVVEVYPNRTNRNRGFIPIQH